MRTRQVDEEKLENLIANLLRLGVVLSAFVVLSGAVMHLGFHPHMRVDYRTFHGEPDNLKTVHGVIHYVFSGQPDGIMQLGLLLLMATPIARVISSAVAFAVEGDRMYLLFTLLVLAVLLYSLFGSFLIS